MVVSLFKIFSLNKGGVSTALRVDVQLIRLLIVCVLFFFT